MLVIASATQDLEFLGVLLMVGACLLLSSRFGVPYPIPLVVGGAILGFAISADIELQPDLVLLVFLPPILYAAAYFSSLRDLKQNARPIGALAIGLVVFTVIGVGLVGHWVLDLPWAAAFTLGAVLAPTDPVAATAIASRVGAPRRFQTVIEGESLVNDSTALIALSFATAAVTTGSFSLAEAGGKFLLTTAVGIAIGVAVGWLISRLRARTTDTLTEIAVSVLTPYLAYLPAEALGASAVLAAVTAGVYLGWRAPKMVPPDTRIQATSFWDTLSFLLNTALFLLVGLQLPGVLDRIRGEYSELTLLGYAAAVVAAVVVIRFVWVFPTTYIPRKLFPKLAERDPAPRWHGAFLLAWTGMRGAVSLAAALSIPVSTQSGAPFPGRDLIIFLTFVVLLSTILFQGATLGPLIKALPVDDDEAETQRHEDGARLKAAEKALERLDELEDEDWVREGTLQRMRELYDFRVKRFGARFEEDDDGDVEEGSLAYQRLRREVLEAERCEIVRLRDEGYIADDVMRRIERDLDLEDNRLEIPLNGAPQPRPAPVQPE